MDIVILISTFFGIGNIKKAPGTWGSLAGIILGIGILHWTENQFLSNPERLLAIEIIGCFLAFLLGIFVSSKYVKKFNREDPKEVVIDEVVGQLLTLFLNFYIIHKSIAVLTFTELWVICYLGSFILFRLFDITKPWPVNWADKKVKGGLGIMLDDILAAIFASLTFSIVILFYLDFLKKAF